MSDMRKLIESVDSIVFANPKQKPGDQVRGTDKAKKSKSGKHPFAGRLVGGACESVDPELDSLHESLLKEYKYFLDELATDEPDDTTPSVNTTSPTPKQQPPGSLTPAAQPAHPEQQQGTAQAGAASQTPAANQAQPAGAGQPAQQTDPVKLAAMQQKNKQDINSHLSQLKSTVDPQLNVPKVANAFDKLQKNPNAPLTPDDTKQMAQLTQTMAPVLANNTGASNLKNLIDKMTKLQGTQQAQALK